MMDYLSGAAKGEIALSGPAFAKIYHIRDRDGNETAEATLRHLRRRAWAVLP